MFTPENLKKLTNVSIISYKKKTKRFELAAYPNKLHEYRHNPQTSLTTVLHTLTIYKDVSKGELANRKDLELVFSTSNQEDVIKEILQHGTERKDEKTRNYEMGQKEREIIGMVMKKVLCEGKYLSYDGVKQLFKENRVSLDARKESKVQANEIVKVIIKNPKYSRIMMRVEVLNVDFEDLKKYGRVKNENGRRILYLTNEEFARFKEIASLKMLRFVILSNDEAAQEEEFL